MRSISGSCALDWIRENLSYVVRFDSAEFEHLVTNAIARVIEFRVDNNGLLKLIKQGLVYLRANRVCHETTVHTGPFLGSSFWSQYLGLPRPQSWNPSHKFQHPLRRLCYHLAVPTRNLLLYADKETEGSKFS